MCVCVWDRRRGGIGNRGPCMSLKDHWLFCDIGQFEERSDTNQFTTKSITLTVCVDNRP